MCLKTHLSDTGSYGNGDTGGDGKRWTKHVHYLLLVRTLLGQETMPSLEGCPHFRGQSVHKYGIGDSN